MGGVCFGGLRKGMRLFFVGGRGKKGGRGKNLDLVVSFASHLPKPVKRERPEIGPNAHLYCKRTSPPRWLDINLRHVQRKRKRTCRPFLS